VNQDAERFAFAMLLRESGEPLLSLRVVSEKQDSGFGEGPLEVDVADLLAAGTVFLTSRFLGAFDQTAIRSKVLHSLEPRDVVDFIEDGQSQHLPDAGDRAQTVEHVGIVLPGLSYDK